MNILLTNDDGITSRGLFAAKVALERFGSVSVIAPDANRYRLGARAVTIHPARCTLGRGGGTARRLDRLSPQTARRWTASASPTSALVGEKPDLIVSGINYGYNLGDDVTYSGTVAAAFEGILLGIPGIAISQGAPTASGSDFRRHESYDFEPSADFLAWWSSACSSTGSRRARS